MITHRPPNTSGAVDITVDAENSCLISNRVREHFGGRGSSVKGRQSPRGVVIEVTTWDGDFHWRASGDSEALAWGRMFAAVPVNPKLHCKVCEP